MKNCKYYLLTLVLSVFLFVNEANAHSCIGYRSVDAKGKIQKSDIVFQGTAVKTVYYYSLWNALTQSNVPNHYTEFAVQEAYKGNLGTKIRAYHHIKNKIGRDNFPHEFTAGETYLIAARGSNNAIVLGCGTFLIKPEWQHLSRSQGLLKEVKKIKSLKDKLQDYSKNVGMNKSEMKLIQKELETYNSFTPKPPEPYRQQASLLYKQAYEDTNRRRLLLKSSGNHIKQRQLLFENTRSSADILAGCSAYWHVLYTYKMSHSTRSSASLYARYSNEAKAVAEFLALQAQLDKPKDFVDNIYKKRIKNYRKQIPSIHVGRDVYLCMSLKDIQASLIRENELGLASRPVMGENGESEGEIKQFLSLPGRIPPPVKQDVLK